MALDTYNSTECESNEVQGLEVLNCNRLDWGNARGGGLFNKGVKTPIASFTEAIYKNLVRGRKVHPFGNLFDFVQTNEDNDKETSTTKVKTTTLKGLIDFQFDWVNDPCKHTAVYKMGGFDKFDLVLFTDKGVIFWHDAKKLNFKGVNCGDFDTKNLMLKVGANSMKTSTTIQVTDVAEFNTRHIFKTYAELGFDLRDVKGVVDAVVEVVGTITAATTVVNVKVKSICGGTNIPSLDLPASVQFGLGGTQATTRTVTAVVYNLSTGNYELTLSGAIGASGTIQPYLQDATGVYKVAENDLGEFFSGQSVLVTV
jgi:hypothetical protein